MSEPRFIFSCSDGGESRRVLRLKNVSSVSVYNMIPLSFDLISIDNTKKNVFPFDFQFPTSLLSGQEQSFVIDNSKFKHRNIGDKAFRFVFSAEDDNSNVYCYTAEKNVEDSRNTDYIAGQWMMTVSISAVEQIVGVDS